MTNRREAKNIINAIKTIAQKPENLDNLERYLSNHFQEWIDKYANTPEGLAFELKYFAEMEI